MDYPSFDIPNEVRRILYDTSNEADLDAYPVVMDLLRVTFEFAERAESIGMEELKLVRKIRGYVDEVLLVHDEAQYPIYKEDL